MTVLFTVQALLKCENMLMICVDPNPLFCVYPIVTTDHKPVLVNDIVSCLETCLQKLSIFFDRLLNMVPHLVKELQEFYIRVDADSGELKCLDNQ